MSFIEILLVAIGLAADAFAVSVSVGSSGIVSDKRSSIRLSFHLGLFQFLMPIIGWYAGSKFSFFIKEFDHWIAFFILFYIGAKMIIEGRKGEEEKIQKNLTKGMSMVIVSIATSIDALAMGLSLAFLNITIFYPSVVIGIVTFILAVIGFEAGAKLKGHFGKGVEIFGGVVLIGVGVKILLSHLVGL